MLELREVHRQRLRGAIEAARAGEDVVFIVLPTEPPTVAWRSMQHSRTQHVILNAWGQVEEWKAVVEREFQAAVNPSGPRATRAKREPRQSKRAAPPTQ